MKEIYGYPRFFGVSYAKNTVKHLQHIIQTMANAGIVMQGILSLQTMDEDTLAAVHRSNIKTEKYDLLGRRDAPRRSPAVRGSHARACRARRTSRSRRDLQQCIDREVQVRIPQTTLLVNSPMNDPDYRAEHKIEVHQPLAPGPAGTRGVDGDVHAPGLLRDGRAAAGVPVVRELRGHASGVPVRPSGDRDTARRTSTSGCAACRAGDPDRWPLIQILTSLVPHVMEPPVSWGLVFDEVRRFLVSEIGVDDDSALDTALRVQLGLVAEPRSGAPRDARAHPRLRRVVPRRWSRSRSRPNATGGPSSCRGSASTARRSSRSTIPASRPRRDRRQHRTARLRAELGVRDADPAGVHRQGADGLDARRDLGQRTWRRPVPQVRRRHISQTNG